VHYWFRNQTDTLFDKQIDLVLKEMHLLKLGSEEYLTLLGCLERLNDLRLKEHREPISRDTIALIAGNLMGILLIVAYEQKHVITSKGFGQVIRPK